MTIDKAKTKKILISENIKMATGILLNKKEDLKLEDINSWGWPIVIKPNSSGSSVGISIVKNETELDEALIKAFTVGDKVLIEKFIKGRELTVVVTDYQEEIIALPVIEIIPKVSDWFDYKAKYVVGGSDEICPANMSDADAKKIQSQAIKIFEILDCRDLARIDFIWNEVDQEFVFLEINTVPGLTETSLTPKALRVAGLSLQDFFVKLIDKYLCIKT